jgi:1-acyl-sn-glycerol-3-phosphate acyltransferase
MIEFSDAPYRFFEARPSPFLIRVGREVNRRFFLPSGSHRISEIRIEGETEMLHESKAKGDRMLFAINHPTHSDAQVLTEIHRRLGVPSCFMAAYDVFLRGGFHAWCMQRMGNFSIDREGSDRKAMAAAIKVLTDGKMALNIYPEGNVFLTNDRLAPFLDGAAFIALKAQAALDGAEVKVVPVSVKFTHLTAPREAVTARMQQLGSTSGYKFSARSSEDPVGAVFGVGCHVLGKLLGRHGFPEEIPADAPTLHERLRSFTDGLVSDVEKGLGIDPSTGQALQARISKARSMIHQIRTNPGSRDHPEIDGLADRAILALRINGYNEPYLAERPSIDRYDETVERIAEDFHSSMMPRTGPRRAMVMIHPPLSVGDFLNSANGKMRGAIPALTAAMTGQVQSGLDALNAKNDAPGAGLLR